MGKANRRTPTYTSWALAKNRCRCPRHHAFANYGGRGITFSKKWDTFEQFVADMGERPPGTSLDRIDNSKGYEPGNCRWASRKEQHRNTRRNVILEYNGKRQCIADWADELHLCRKLISNRLKRGWSVERALTTFPSA